VRLLGGGLVRSVRAQAGRWMPERPCPGNFSAYLEFEDGTPATIVYNGYGYFDTSELTWGIGNRMYSDEERVQVRKALRSGAIDHEVAKEGMRFGAAASDPTSRGIGHASTEKPVGTRAHMHWFGITVASFERGDCRMSPNGIYVYGDEGRREIEVFGGRGVGTLEQTPSGWNRGAGPELEGSSIVPSPRSFPGSRSMDATCGERTASGRIEASVGFDTRDEKGGLGLKRRFLWRNRERAKRGLAPRSSHERRRRCLD